MSALLPCWADVPLPVIGMLHLPPLPGSPRFGGDLNALREWVLRDAEALASGGVQGLMMENFGDTPFFPERLPAHTVAWMSVLAEAVRTRFDLPLGINCLRNDGVSALAIAHAVGGAFIRVNVLSGARVTDQGVIQGHAHLLLRERAQLGAEEIRIFADVDVKHSAPLGAARPLAEETADLVQRGGADAVIVSGGATGQPTDTGQVQQVSAAAAGTPVLVGSGVTAESAARYRGLASGLIVGTTCKRNGIASEPVDIERVRALMARL